MKVKWQFPALVALLALLGVSLQFGCEGTDGPDTGDVDSYFASHPYVSDPRDPTSPHDLVVTPDSATVSYVGQMITFTVKGGTPSYTWHVVNSNGRIRSADGDGSQGIYNSDAVAANTVIVFDSNGHSAIAAVGTGAASSVVIAPASGTCSTNGAVLAFAASGGSPPYTWTVLNGHGSLNTTTGASVLYTRISSGDNGLTVSDSLANTSSVGITQP